MKNKSTRRTSQYPAVSWYAPLQKWRATPNIQKTRYDLGVFATDKEAWAAIQKLRAAHAAGKDLVVWMDRWKMRKTDNGAGRRWIKKRYGLWSVSIQRGHKWHSISGIPTLKDAEAVVLELRRFLRLRSDRFIKAWLAERRAMFRGSEIVAKKTHAVIILRDGTGKKTGETKISMSDVKRVKGLSAWLTQYGYAAVNVNGRSTLLHRHLLYLPSRYPPVDHINRDRLDNRQENLRESTPGRNSQNISGYGASGFRGVSSASGRPGWWRVQVKVRGKSYGKRYRSKHKAAYMAYKLRQRYMTDSVEDVLVYRRKGDRLFRLTEEALAAFYALSQRKRH